ncbi:MAG: ABC transporter permease [Gemmobacter sp.]
MRRTVTRLLGAVPVLAGVVLLAFVLTRVLPGDPVAVLGGVPGMTPEDTARLATDLGLDRSLAAQFLDYLAALSRGDLGLSRSTGRPVAAEIAVRLPATLELAGLGFLLALLLAVPLGTVAALRPGGAVDAGVRLSAVIAGSVPTFVTGILLIHIFYFRLGWAPEPVGRIDPMLARPEAVTGFLLIDSVLAGDLAALRSAAGRIALPALAMALFALAPILRMQRAALMAARGSAALVAMRGLGVGRWRRGFWALRLAAGPVVSVAALALAWMLGANVLVEHVFAWPGIGSYALAALVALDFAPVQGVMLVTAAILVGVAVLADLVQGWFDPRLADG